MERQLPERIRKRSGSVEPFRPDQLTRSLFAATEQLGTPDAFLARELADGVLHFLSRETDAPELSTEALAELTIKVVRELGHPRLAEVYRQQIEATQPPVQSSLPTSAPAGESVFAWLDASAQLDPLVIGRYVLQRYHLDRLLPRELADAHREGLLRIQRLDAPLELYSAVFTAWHAAGFATWADTAIAIAREWHFDGMLEWLHERHGRTPSAAEQRDAIRECTLALQWSQRTGVVHLNPLLPPAWTTAMASGPLFADTVSEDHRSEDAVNREAAMALAETILQSNGPLRFAWHYRETDSPATLEPLLARWPRSHWPELILDSSRRPIRLGLGLARPSPGVLAVVGLHLPKLLERWPAISATEFLHKLASLARLAKAVGLARQEWLRQHGPPYVRSGFLLDRATLVLVPEGIAEVTQTLVGEPMTPGSLGLDWARQCLRTLREAGEQEPPQRFEVILEPIWNAGLEALTWKQQCKVAASLRHCSGTGSMVLPVSANTSITQVLDAVESARKADLPRLRFAVVE